MKHYKIASRFRFISFITFICIAVLFILMGAVNRSAAYEKRDMRFTEITVMEGDTLWAIAKEHPSEGRDIRDVIYDICRINGIKAGDLRPGQTIMVPEE